MTSINSQINTAGTFYSQNYASGFVNPYPWMTNQALYSYVIDRLRDRQNYFFDQYEHSPEGSASHKEAKEMLEDIEHMYNDFEFNIDLALKKQFLMSDFSKQKFKPNEISTPLVLDYFKTFPTEQEFFQYWLETVNPEILDLFPIIKNSKRDLYKQKE